MTRTANQRHEKAAPGDWCGLLVFACRVYSIRASVGAVGIEKDA